MRYRQARHDEPLIMELGTRSDDVDLGASGLPVRLLRKEPIGIPILSESEVVRHYTVLSQMNYGVDSGFYPLGSCTMKFNPKLSEQLAAGSEEMSFQSGKVASASEQMSTNMNEVATVTAAMSRKVASAASSATDVSTNINSVAAAIEEIISTIQDIAHSCADAAENRSKKLGQPNQILHPYHER